MLVIGLLVVLNGLALWGILRAVDQKSWVGVGVIAVCTALVDVVYATRRFIPAKYLLPGSIFLVLFAVFPVIYTVYLSFTNYGTGHLSRSRRRSPRSRANSLQALPEATRYRADIMETPDGELFLAPHRSRRCVLHGTERHAGAGRPGPGADERERHGERVRRCHGADRHREERPVRRRRRTRSR